MGHSPGEIGKVDAAHRACARFESQRCSPRLSRVGLLPWNLARGLVCCDVLLSYAAHWGVESQQPQPSLHLGHSHSSGTVPTAVDSARAWPHTFTADDHDIYPVLAVGRICDRMRNSAGHFRICTSRSIAIDPHFQFSLDLPGQVERFFLLPRHYKADFFFPVSG